LLVVAGETASGKTALAVRLARAWGGEIIGADSVQIYRGFDVGSGKPTGVELDGVVHHMIDIVDPGDAFDAGAFVARADRLIAEVRARGRTPIVCGGTFMWIKALVFGLAAAPPAPIEIRDSLRAEAEAVGSPAMHAKLARVDPVTAARLHPNDATRITRALEVFEATGRPLADHHAEHGFRTERHRARIVAIAHERADLEQRIAKRVEAMLAAGWVEEVRALIDRGHRDARAMSSVGYAEVRDHVEGRLDAAELAARITRSTRIFARRQRTWLGSANVARIPPIEAARR
jgi:tRNA dimethylallyltransferase